MTTSEQIFFYLLSLAGFPNLFWLVKMLRWCFLIFWIFLLFFGIFYYGSGRNTAERFFLFYLFLDLSQPILARKEALMVFSNFLNSFAIFLEFSITGREETQRNDLLPFLSFVAFPDLFWLETKLWWYFLNFWIFLLFFWNFLWWFV